MKFIKFGEGFIEPLTDENIQPLSKEIKQLFVKTIDNNKICYGQSGSSNLYERQEINVYRF